MSTGAGSASGTAAAPPATPDSGTNSYFYVVELDSLDLGSAVMVERLYLTEFPNGGWQGFAVVDPGGGRISSAGNTLASVLAYQFVPGSAVALGLWLRTWSTGASEADGLPLRGAQLDAQGPGYTSVASEMQALPLRTWPSVITNLTTMPSTAGSLDTVCQVRFSDPLSRLSGQRIWGVFRECPLAELLGGALSLAGGGDGLPTATPALRGLPTIRISQALREAAAEIPYAIATGQTLGHWLDSVFGRLGVRIEMLGAADGGLDILLLDRPPTGMPLDMTLNAGHATAGNAVISRMGHHPASPERGAVMDNPTTGASRRLGEAGAVETLLYAAGLSVEEAGARANFSQERSTLNLADIRVTTAQPGVHPGRLMAFSNRPVNGSALWQTQRTRHAVADGMYRNEIDLVKSGLAWRPPVPADAGPVIMSALVDDGESTVGESVARDRLGRIPVAFGFTPGAIADQGPEGTGPSDADDDAGEDEAVAGALSVHLPVVEPMAGGLHGFVPAHRQGDKCRISVQNPLYAEIIGFSYGNDRRVGQSLVDASMGMVVRHGDDQWSGLLFRPKAAIDSEEDSS